MACREAGTSKVLGEEMHISKTPDPRLHGLEEEVLARNGFVICYKSSYLHCSSYRGQTEVKQRSNRGQALCEERQRTNGQSLHKWTYNILLTGFFV